MILRCEKGASLSQPQTSCTGVILLIVEPDFPANQRIQGGLAGRFQGAERLKGRQQNGGEQQKERKIGHAAEQGLGFPIRIDEFGG